jgi:transposase
MKAKRKKHSATFKTQVVLEALKERETLAELSKRFEVHAQIISNWKQEFLKKAETVFEKKYPETDNGEDLEKLYAKIGQLEIEKDFLKKNLKKLGL